MMNSYLLRLLNPLMYLVH